jgi:hypothetical protein
MTAVANRYIDDGISGGGDSHAVEAAISNS